MFSNLGIIPNIILTIIWGAGLITGLIIEPILNYSWNKAYFIKGLPIFMVRVSAKPRYSNVPRTSQFDAHFHSTWFLWDISLLFKELDMDVYGFREKNFIHPLYPLVMHGMLYFDKNNDQVIVTGFLNWLVPCIVVVGFMLLSFAPLIELLIFLPFILFFGISYWIQFNRFSKVAEFAAHSWARKHLKEMAGA
jgi:hypothetical protein